MSPQTCEFCQKKKMQVGLSGEKSNVFTEQGAKTTGWQIAESFPSQPLVWYMVINLFNVKLVNSFTSAT